MKSTRLPAKALLDIKGKPAIVHLIDYLKLARSTDLIVLCTSTHPDDAVLATVAGNNSIECFRGSEDDKLDRYLNAAKKYGVDFMIITHGDSVIYDPQIIDEVSRLYRQTGADYIACRGLPIGTAPHGLKLSALETICRIKAESDTEVWESYFTDSGFFKVECLEADEGLRHPEMRMTLDYPEDYEFFRTVFDRLYSPGKAFTLREAVSLLLANPELMEINREAQTAYLKHLKKSAPMRLKDLPNASP